MQLESIHLPCCEVPSITGSCNFLSCRLPTWRGLPAEPCGEEMSLRDPETSDCLSLLLIKANLGVSWVSRLGPHYCD